jgi:hypothetical protein
MVAAVNGFDRNFEAAFFDTEILEGTEITEIAICAQRPRALTSSSNGPRSLNRERNQRRAAPRIGPASDRSPAPALDCTGLTLRRQWV